MSDTKIIDGKVIAADLRAETAIKVEDFKNKFNKIPTLAVVLVGRTSVGLSVVVRFLWCFGWGLVVGGVAHGVAAQRHKADICASSP